jgi:hypothetical protein
MLAAQDRAVGLAIVALTPARAREQHRISHIHYT